MMFRARRIAGICRRVFGLLFQITLGHARNASAHTCMESSIPTSEVHVPARRDRNGTSFYAGPLLCIGLVCTVMGIWRTPDPRGAVIALSVGVFYLLSGLLLYSSWIGAPKLAMLAWAPFFLAVPVGTVMAFFVYRGLRDRCRPSARTNALQLGSGRTAWALSAAVHAFVSEFGAYEDAQGQPLSVSRDLHIPPGTFARFLDDIRIDYGLPTSGADADRVDSLQELLELLSERCAA
jgi:hypothetical protein